MAEYANCWPVFMAGMVIGFATAVFLKAILVG